MYYIIFYFVVSLSAVALAEDCNSNGVEDLQDVRVDGIQAVVASVAGGAIARGDFNSDGRNDDIAVFRTTPVRLRNVLQTAFDNALN